MAAMNRWLLAVAFVTTALAGPVAVQGWAAQEIQVLRKDTDVGSTKMLPFTTYQKEVQAAMQDLPCKWVSMDGRLGPSYGSGRYDFLCKGGDWATVSLFYDKSSSGGVGRVRLMYREWKDNVHPNAGEAFIAQQFLQHVMNRFVPANSAGQVMEGFWQNKNRDWAGDGVKVSFSVDSSHNDFDVRSLEVVGTATGLTTTPAAALPQPITAKPVPMVPVPLVTPTDAGLSKAPPLAPVATPQVQEPAVVLPQAPVSLPVPQNTGAPVVPVKELQVPADAPAAQITSTLIKASPAELNTAPAPESLAKPAPLPPVSSSLIPNPEAAIMGREQAPSNFAAYNRAVELTKDLEKKAMIAPPDKVKSVVAPTPQAKAQATASKPAGKEVPVGIDRQRDPNAELGLPKDATVAAPQAPQDPRFAPVRPLPQLKFIPKAEPLPETNDPIQFEDQGSGL
jgi:hypothetical protein